ncbi:CPBP family intramembrane metalloprotease [bacterium]|nr:CPBP family intramembrane metalloprotease [bacterium]
MKPMRIPESFLFTGIPALLLCIAVRLAIPALGNRTGWRPLLCWYLCGGLLVFIPLLAASFILIRRENRTGGRTDWIRRFRLTKPSAAVLGWSLTGTVVIGLLTWLLMQAGQRWIPGFSASPAFLRVEPLGPGEKWLIAAWLPMFFLNIIGEGLYWRGFMFPRQQAAYGNRAWILHGLCWTLFHFSFGFSLVFILLPILFLTPWIVARTRSTWPDIIIHGLVNGSGFLLVAFGAVR